MLFELNHIIAEAEELKATAKLHDAHSFVGFKLVATMARSIQQTPSPAAALNARELKHECPSPQASKEKKAFMVWWLLCCRR